MTNSFVQAIRFALYLLIISIVCGLLAQQATASNLSDRYSGWQPWSETIASDVFDISQCQDNFPRSADMNNDGQDDLLCLYSFPNAMSVFVQFAGSNGYSNWQRWGPQTSTLQHCQDFKIAKFTPDALNDILCVYYHESEGMTVYLMPNDPESTSQTLYATTEFLSPTLFRWDYCHNFVIADVLGDGTETLVCPYVYPDGSTKTFALVRETGWAASWAIISPTTPSSQVQLDSCSDITVGDVDGNQEPDLMCTYEYLFDSIQHSVTLVQRMVDGEFVVWGRWSEASASNIFDWQACTSQNRIIMPGDIDGDGLTDQICVYKYPSGTASVFIQTDSDSTTNQQHGSWIRWSSEHSALPVDNCIGLQFGDANADGLTDLVCVYQYPDGRTVTAVNASNGTDYFAWPSWSSTTVADVFDILACEFITLADANGDGRADVICPYVYPDGSTKTFVQSAYSHTATAVELSGASAEAKQPLLLLTVIALSVLTATILWKRKRHGSNH